MRYRIAGVVLLSLPFIAMIVGEIVSAGIAQTLVTWGIVVAVFVALFGGIFLIDRGRE